MISFVPVAQDDKTRPQSGALQFNSALTPSRLGLRMELCQLRLGETEI